MITQFTIACSKTINLGNFQNIKIEAQVVVQVPDSADNDAYQQLKREAQAELTRLLEETYKAQNKRGAAF